MNWYTLSKKNKRKKKRKNPWSDKAKKVIEPYVFDEELGLMFHTPNGLAWADLISYLEKTGNENSELTVTAENDAQIETEIAKLEHEKPGAWEKAKKMLSRGIPAALALWFATTWWGNYTEIDRYAQGWYSAIQEFADQGASGFEKGSPLRGVLIEMLKKHEGYRTKMYYDTKGNPTIGVGFNLNRYDAKSILQSVGADYETIMAGGELSDPQIVGILDNTIDEAIGTARSKFSNFDNLDPAAQAIVIDMCFNMGGDRIGRFKKMRDSLDDNDGGDLPLDYGRAREEMIDSEWYNQVGNRSRSLTDMMKLVDRDN